MKKLMVFSATFLLLACGGSRNEVSSTPTPTEESLVISPNPENLSISKPISVDLDDPNRSLRGTDLTDKQLEIQLHPLNASDETKTYTLFEHMESKSLPDVIFPSWCTGKIRYVGHKLMADIWAKDFTPPEIPNHQADTMHFIIGDSLNLRLLALNEILHNPKSIGINQSRSSFNQHQLVSGYVSCNIWPNLHLINATHKFRDIFYTSVTVIKSFDYDALHLLLGGTTDKYNKYFYQSFMLKKSGCTLSISSLISKVSTATFSFKIEL